MKADLEYEHEHKENMKISKYLKCFGHMQSLTWHFKNLDVFFLSPLSSLHPPSNLQASPNDL